MNFATLPDRTVAMFARMGDPDAISELRLRVKKYSPDQARDEGGRFASGEGGSSSFTIENRVKDASLPAGWSPTLAKYISSNKSELKDFIGYKKTESERQAFLKKEFENYQKTLSPQQVEAIDKYVAGSKEMNFFASGAPQGWEYALTPALQEKIDSMKEAINGSKLSEDVVLERGMVSYSPINVPQVGEVVSGNGGFISTTLSPTIAEQFSSTMYLRENEYHSEGDATHSAVWHIYAPEGTSALPVNVGGMREQVSEKEVVLLPDTKFEIVATSTAEVTPFMRLSSSGSFVQEPDVVNHIWAKVIS